MIDPPASWLRPISFNLQRVTGQTERECYPKVRPVQYTCTVGHCSLLYCRMETPRFGHFPVGIIISFLSTEQRALHYCIKPSKHSMDRNETLHFAAHSGDLDRVRELLAQGYDINGRNHNNETPLHFAACDQLAIVT